MQREEGGANMVRKSSWSRGRRGEGLGSSQGKFLGSTIEVPETSGKSLGEHSEQTSPPLYPIKRSFYNVILSKSV